MIERDDMLAWGSFSVLLLGLALAMLPFTLGAYWGAVFPLCAGLWLLVSQPRGARGRCGVGGRIRVSVGVCMVLGVILAYCLNPSHTWSTAMPARPVDHIVWLPASTYALGSWSVLWVAATVLVTFGLASRLHREQVASLVMVLSGVVAVVAVRSVAQRLSPGAYSGYQAVGGFSNENHLAACINLIWPVAVVWGLRYRLRMLQTGGMSSVAGPLWLAASIMLVALYLTGSRAGIGMGLLFLIVLLASLLIAVRRTTRPPMPGEHALWAVVAAALIAVAGYLVYWLARGTGDSGLAGDLHFRGTILADTLKMWRDRPIWGTGPGTFPWVFPFFQSLPAERYSILHAHCDPLELFAEYGVLGSSVLIAGMCLAILPVRLAASSMQRFGGWRLETIGLTLALCGVLLHSLVDFPFRHPAIILIAACWGGILVSREGGVHHG